ncbi:unnamed protein product [Ectocarpus fasciculatus]
MGRPPSAHGFSYVIRADGKEWEVALNRLVEPLTSWWVEPSDFEGGHQAYAQLPADTRFALGSSDDLKGTLVNGPTADGTYKVYVSKQAFNLHGTKLAIPVETRLHLRQLATFRQEIYSLRTHVGGQDAYISELKRKELTTAAALTTQKSECERAEERISKIEQGAEKAICSLKIQVGDRDAYISELKRKATTTAAALTKQKSECEKAEERISKIVQGEKLMLSSAGEHDYGSNLPSPADLVQRIASIQDQLFVDWVAEALGDPSNTWLISPNGPAALFDTTQAAYEGIVKTLLLTFLECEVQRSTPLKFSDNFGSKEAWNSDDHHKDTFDPSYEGDKLVEGRTRVQVVIPRLFWEKKMVDDSVSTFFETQASFVIPSA